MITSVFHPLTLRHPVTAPALSTKHVSAGLPIPSSSCRVSASPLPKSSPLRSRLRSGVVSTLGVVSAPKSSSLRVVAVSDPESSPPPSRLCRRSRLRPRSRLRSRTRLRSRSCSLSSLYPSAGRRHVGARCSINAAACCAPPSSAARAYRRKRRLRRRRRPGERASTPPSPWKRRSLSTAPLVGRRCGMNGPRVAVPLGPSTLTGTARAERRVEWSGGGAPLCAVKRAEHLCDGVG